MKPLRPIAVLTLGPIIIGSAFVAAATLLLPGPATVRAVVSIFLAGVILGLLVFGPIVAGESTRSVFVYRHLHALDRWTLIPLGMGIGHLLLMNLGDNGILVASLLCILCAALRVYLGLQARRGALEEESFQ